MTARRPARGYRRRALLARHTERTGLSVTPEIAEAAALSVCRRAPASARDMLEMLGLIHPDGPARVEVRIVRAAPKRDARRKRAKLR